MEVPVLEKGYVRLVASMGDDLSPLEYARMSTDTPTGVDTRKDDKLRERLWKDAHTSPFEAVELAVELKVPMFVLRHLDRHRTLEVEGMVLEDYDEFRKWTSRNEFSTRYSVIPDEFYIPPPERFKRKDMFNKQGSGEPLSPEEQARLYEKFKDVLDICCHTYDGFIHHGVASELARAIVPPCQYVKIRLKANGLHWVRFFNLRLKSDVQEETRAYAVGIARIFRTLFPKLWGAFEEHTLLAVTLSRSEKDQVVEWLQWIGLTHPMPDNLHSNFLNILTKMTRDRTSEPLEILPVENLTP